LVTDEGGDVVGAKWAELELDGSMPVEQALAGQGQRVGHRSRPMREHDADPLVVREQWVVLSSNDVALGDQAVTQRRRLTPGRNTQLTLQRAGHAFELTQGRMAIAVRRVASHEGEMSELVARVELDHRLPATIEAQQVEIAQTELLAALLRPRLVPVVGQQLTAVHRQRLTGGGDILIDQSRAGEVLKPLDVDGRVGIGA
jgi:hypothetical protein